MEPAVTLPVYYLGPIAYFKQIFRAGNCVLHTGELYERQTPRNHCVVYGANGLIKLTVPVNHKKSLPTLTRDVRIACDENWKRVHWHTMTSCYNKSAFFEYYADYFHSVYQTPYSFLLDFTFKLMETTLHLLKFENKLTVVENRGGNTPSNWFETGEDYQQEYYQPFSYKFGFMPNLSIIDLLVNQGPGAKNFLQ